MVRAAHGREQLAISVAKINYNREINKVFLLLLGIRAACSLCRGNKKGEIILVSRAMKGHSLLAVDDFVHLPSIYSFYFLNGILIRKICLYLWRIF